MGEKVTFGGIEMANPLIASSSPLTETVGKVHSCREASFGGAILKTAADYQRTGKGYGRKVVFIGEDYYADASYEREILTLEEGVALFQGALSVAGDMAVIPSVSANSMEAEDWVFICRRFEDLGARLIQLDFFYLGTRIAPEDEGFYRRLGEFLAELQGRLHCIVMPKLNFNFDPEKTCKALAAYGIRQVSLLDSIRCVLPARFGLHQDTTSYFGRKQLPLTLTYLRHAVEAGLEACAGGGVSGAEDVELLLENGAKLVQTASFVLRNGFRYAPTLLHGEPASQGQYAWCTAEGYGGKGCEHCGFCRKAGRAEV